MIKKIYILLLVIITGIVITLPRDPAITETYLHEETSEVDDDQPDDWSSSNRGLNPVHMVVVFTKFNDELEDSLTAPTWSDRLFDGENGSVNHYFDTISFGQYKVNGEVFPYVIELPRDTEYYQYTNVISDYAVDALKQLNLHPDFDFSDFDNDGPDGIPGSGDDDGYLDYMVLMPYGTKPRALRASGKSTLGINTFSTNDKDSNNNYILANRYSGCIVDGTSGFILASGTLCHEYIHSFNGIDLYDTGSDDYESESAGIGFWGIMAYGTLGWDWGTGAVPPSAYNRIKLGIVGINNDNLIDVYGIQRNLRIRNSSDPDGKIYRIHLTEKEYFLVEFRSSEGSYYDRHTPKDGLLIWHVNKGVSGNRFEERKMVDLECADGKWKDAGYPRGKVAAPTDGRDNLDFWSKSSSIYTTQHAGNCGDSTDVFDGEIYTEFGPYTNPNTSTYDGILTDVRIFNIRREGDEMLFNVDTAPFINWSNIPYPLNGLAFYRFNPVFEHLTSAAKPADAVYVVSEPQTREIQSLVVSYTDSVEVIPIDNDEETDIQTYIKLAFMGTNNAATNHLLVRKTLSAEDIVQEPTIVTSAIGTDNVSVQRITSQQSPYEHPDVFDLHQNYPNPFNSQTTIPFTLSAAQKIRLDVYNILGQQIRSLDLGYRHAGMHTYRFVPDGLSSGVYLIRLTGASQSMTRRLVYMR